MKIKPLTIVLTLLVAIILGGLLGYQLFWPKNIDRDNLINSVSAGQLINITSESFFLVIRIETNEGIYYTRGPISAPKDQEVFVREDSQSNKYLCLESHQECMEIINY
tara:strand:+ start:48632 stop:48955 length:324 start_codon:yes stop_codon:yes gene_type:complete